MELVELTPLSGALVGMPGVDGLSTEQRKRLTIAVELVANPSIVFMDEPTSGLDARAAAIVMRTVRNIVNTGRTIVCTIHQPSIDIFESFDEVSLSFSLHPSFTHNVHTYKFLCCMSTTRMTFPRIQDFLVVIILDRLSDINSNSCITVCAAFIYEARRRAYICRSSWHQILSINQVF